MRLDFALRNITLPAYNVMPPTKSRSCQPTTTKVAAAKRAKGKSTSHRSAALPLADARSSEASVLTRMMDHLQHRHSSKCERRPDISVAEMLKSCRATAQSGRMADRWSYTVPIPLHSILEVLELIMPEQMSALAVYNIQMMNDGAFANVRLPSYASVIDALMQ